MCVERVCGLLCAVFVGSTCVRGLLCAVHVCSTHASHFSHERLTSPTCVTLLPFASHFSHMRHTSPACVTLLRFIHPASSIPTWPPPVSHFGLPPCPTWAFPCPTWASPRAPPGPPRASTSDIFVTGPTLKPLCNPPPNSQHVHVCMCARFGDTMNTASRMESTCRIGEGGGGSEHRPCHFIELTVYRLRAASLEDMDFRV